MTRCEQTFDFGEAPRNTICWSPHARFLAIAGFGNLSGELSSWDPNPHANPDPDPNPNPNPNPHPNPHPNPNQGATDPIGGMPVSHAAAFGRVDGGGVSKAFLLPTP